MPYCSALSTERGHYGGVVTRRPRPSPPQLGQQYHHLNNYHHHHHHNHHCYHHEKKQYSYDNYDQYFCRHHYNTNQMSDTRITRSTTISTATSTTAAATVMSGRHRLDDRRAQLLPRIVLCSLSIRVLSTLMLQVFLMTTFLHAGRASVHEGLHIEPGKFSRYCIFNTVYFKSSPRRISRSRCCIYSIQKFTQKLFKLRLHSILLSSFRLYNNRF